MASGASALLKRKRIGVIRESMLVRPGDKAAEPIATAAAKEIKTILGERLGVTLVESCDPAWERDRDLEQMNPIFGRALRGSCPSLCQTCFFG
jgi:amidase